MIRALSVLLVLALALPAAALELALPKSARLTAERNTDPDIYNAPASVFQGGDVSVISVEGTVRRAAWRLDTGGLTPLQVMRPLRAQLQAAGFEIALDCASAVCGGFDFR